MELDLTTIAASIASVPVIIALVNLVKTTVGDIGRYAALLAVGIGIVLSASKYAFLTEVPLDAKGWFLAVAGGLLLGLAASGLWDVADRVSANKSTVTVVPADPDPIVANEVTEQ